MFSFDVAELKRRWSARQGPGPGFLPSARDVGASIRGVGLFLKASVLEEVERRGDAPLDFRPLSARRSVITASITHKRSALGGGHLFKAAVGSSAAKCAL